MNKELEAYDYIVNLVHDFALSQVRFGRKQETTSKLEIIWKALKALEIIKNKKVDISLLDGFFDYNSCENIYQKLTDEEKSLLKEVLK